MYKYAQINIETKRCIGVSCLSGEIKAEHMLLLTDDDDVQPGDIYSDGEWTRPEPEPLPEPGPTAEERIESLEAENARLVLELAQNQIRFDQMEQAQAALLLTLVEKEVL